MGSAEWLDPVNEQLSQELRFAKSVLRGMIKKGAIDPSIQSGARYFFKEEEPGGFEDTLNFDHTGLPVHDMMQHSEVEDSIEVFIRKREFIDTTNLKDNATLEIVCESLLRATNLLRVKVESVDLTCAELLQQYLHSNTPFRTRHRVRAHRQVGHPTSEGAAPRRDVARAPALDCSRAAFPQG